METKYQCHVLISKLYASDTPDQERREAERELKFKGIKDNYYNNTFRRGKHHIACFRYLWNH